MAFGMAVNHINLLKMLFVNVKKMIIFVPTEDFYLPVLNLYFALFFLKT